MEGQRWDQPPMWGTELAIGSPGMGPRQVQGGTKKKWRVCCGFSLTSKPQTQKSQGNKRERPQGRPVSAGVSLNFCCVLHAHWASSVPMKARKENWEGKVLVSTLSVSQWHSSQSLSLYSCPAPPWLFLLWGASASISHPAWSPALLPKSSYYLKSATDIPGHPKTPLTTCPVMIPARNFSGGPM